MVPPNRQMEGSLPCAKKTLDVLRLIVTNKKHSTAAALIDEIRTVGYKMQTARPVGERRSPPKDATTNSIEPAHLLRAEPGCPGALGRARQHHSEALSRRTGAGLQSFAALPSALCHRACAAMAPQSWRLATWSGACCT